MKHNKRPKIWRRILLLIVIAAGYRSLSNKFSYQETITIKQGDTFQKLVDWLEWKNKVQVKLYVKYNDIDLSNIQMGSYIFSWNYTPKTFVDIIVLWPRISYHTIKVLEWRSIYDIDRSLSSKSLIMTGQFISFATDQSIISKYAIKYSFLPSGIKSLEWFLYPDTYKVDTEKDIIDQLVYLQLENFKKRVWDKASSITPPQWLDWYNSIILASIVEKEERVDANRPTVAGILLKRYQLGTLVGADISLCYFFEMPYSDCTPNFIANKVSDNNNPYNTRSVKWLPPTPVSNPSANSIFAVLEPQLSDYFYYLHDSNWAIHYAKTLGEHNTNKKNYIQ